MINNKICASFCCISSLYIICFLLDIFPLRVILLSPSAKTLTCDFTKFAFIFLDSFLATSSEDLPAITDNLLNKKCELMGFLSFEKIIHLRHYRDQDLLYRIYQ